MYCNFCPKDCQKYVGICIAIIVLIAIISITLICSNTNCNNKNILTAIAVPGDNIQTGTTAIKFSQNDIVVGNAITHQNGSNTININETGIYQISYQLYGVEKNASSFNFNAVLLVNDMPVNSTFNEGAILENKVNNRYTLTSTVILKLNAGDTLKLQGVSIEDITYEKARIDIEKID